MPGQQQERHPSISASAGPPYSGVANPAPRRTILRPQSRLINMQSATAQAESQAPAQASMPPPWVVPMSGRSTAGRSVYNLNSSRAPTVHIHKIGHMGQFNLGTQPPSMPAVGAYNPSEGPSPSVAPAHWRSHSRAPTQASAASSIRPAVVKNDIYTISGRKRKDFRQGEVIALPFHVANTNPNVDPMDERLTKTWLGPAFTKRRMMVVLWIFQESMFCLPLYSFSERGLAAKADHLQKEYVCMKNVGDHAFVNAGVYEPVEIRTRVKPMTPETTVQLTGGTRVSFDEDISMVGRLTQDSYDHLVEIWHGINNEAYGQEWRR